MRPQLRGLMLFGAKHGDNEQVRTLAQAIELADDRIRLEFNRLHLIPNVFLPGTPFNLVRRKRQRLDEVLHADVIITSGKRTYRAARYLKRRFGGDTVWIHIGRPWGPFDEIDLIITSPQYGLPPGPKVLQLPYPITKPRLREVPVDSDLRPDRCIAALVGGKSSSHVVDSSVFKEVILAAHAAAEAYQYPLRIITSPRTPAHLSEQVKTFPDEFAKSICWSRNHAALATTPYQFALRDGHAFVVTSDSASMVAEAIETGKPVFIIPARKRFLARAIGVLLNMMHVVIERLACAHIARSLLATAVVRGFYTPPRDVEKLIDAELEYVEHSVVLSQQPVRIASCRKGNVASPLALATARCESLLRAVRAPKSEVPNNRALTATKRFAG